MPFSTLLTRRILYVSELAPAMPSNVVGQVLRQSRERNHRLKLSGALLFDGERFCQLLEGDPDTTQNMMQRIKRDTRHGNVQLLLDTLSPAPRLMMHWRCGYCDHDAFDRVHAAAAVDPQRPVHAFLRLLSTSDLSN